jgi:hypothetical protein
MATYIEYELEDGTTVLIESSEPETGVVRAGTKGGIRTTPAKKKFEEALTEIKPWAATLRRQLNDLMADEVEVTFGIKAIGEAGIFAVGKVGGEANYEVTLKWSNRESE